MELQELISRGRFIFAKAPGRRAVFESVNGRSSAKMISKMLGRKFTNTLRDLQALRHLELIQPRKDKSGNIIKAEDSIVYEKTPLARQIPLSYFRDSIKAARHFKHATSTRRESTPRTKPLPIPSENEILDICNRGEDEIHEFKGPAQRQET